MEQETKFEGWAVVELFGHQRETGHVSTVYFGDKAMFQLDVPALPEREIEIKSARYVDGRFCPEGTRVTLSAVEGRTRLISPGAIYALNPCTEEVARKTLDNPAHREIKQVSLPPSAALSSGGDEADCAVEDLDEEEF